MVTVADTAFSIAMIRAEESDKSPAERLFQDPLAHLFRPSEPEAIEATERFLALPFFRELIRLRTRSVDDALVAAVRAGLRQVVMLGTGFDTRAWRFPELRAAGMRSFEVDFPDQLRRKKAILSAANIDLHGPVSWVPCDFTSDTVGQDLETGLLQGGFRRGEGVAFVWEGVLEYIDVSAIDKTFRWIVNVGGPGARVIFTHAAFRFDPESPEAHLKKLGFSRFDGLGLDKAWRDHAFPGDPPMSAEISCVSVATV